jgi:hypothetical protein
VFVTQAFFPMRREHSFIHSIQRRGSSGHFLIFMIVFFMIVENVRVIMQGEEHLCGSCINTGVCGVGGGAHMFASPKHAKTSRHIVLTP